MESIEKLHIGNLIRTTLNEQGRTVAWLARQVNCSHNNIYKVFQKSSIDTDLLLRISRAMDYNFFQHFK